MRRMIPRRDRQRVTARANRRCEYCKSPEAFSPDAFSIDHIVPVSLGGSDDLHNLALSCQGCNASKLDVVEARDPETNDLAPLFNPREDNWYGHFEWNDDFTLINGITPTGRATIDRLKLNRAGLVNLRRQLRIAGEEHPPHESE